MLEELMASPIAWFILSLCTLFSVLFALYTWIFGNKRKEISVDYSSIDIIRQGKQSIPKLKIKYDDKIIQDLSSTIVYIWNSGNDLINFQDIVATKGLKIRNNEGQILDAQVIKQSDESNSFVISNFTSQIVDIRFDYIDSGEGAKLQILHTGSGNALFVECKVKGGKAIRNCRNLIKYKGLKGFLITFLHELAPLIFLMLGLILSSCMFQMLGFTLQKNIFTIILCSFVVAVVLMLIYIKIRNKINKVFNKIIPEILKE